MVLQSRKYFIIMFTFSDLNIEKIVQEEKEADKLPLKVQRVLKPKPVSRYVGKNGFGGTCHTEYTTSIFASSNSSFEFAVCVFNGDVCVCCFVAVRKGNCF